jgi:hypothetical protein
LRTYYDKNEDLKIQNDADYLILDKIVILPSKRNSFGDFKDELQVNINRDGYGQRPVLRKLDSNKLKYTNTESQKKTGTINFQKI